MQNYFSTVELLKETQFLEAWEHQQQSMKLEIKTKRLSREFTSPRKTQPHRLSKNLLVTKLLTVLIRFNQKKSQLMYASEPIDVRLWANWCTSQKYWSQDGWTIKNEIMDIGKPVSWDDMRAWRMPNQSLKSTWYSIYDSHWSPPIAQGNIVVWSSWYWQDSK